jgi:hypothetical protein
MIAFMNVYNNVPPTITGQSKKEADLTRSLPDPGMENITSKTATPENAIGKVIAIEVKRKGRAFLSACLKTTSFSDNPFALAVRM